MTDIAAIKKLQWVANRLDNKGHFDLANKLDLISKAFVESGPNKGAGEEPSFFVIGPQDFQVLLRDLHAWAPNSEVLRQSDTQAMIAVGPAQNYIILNVNPEVPQKDNFKQFGWDRALSKQGVAAATAILHFAFDPVFMPEDTLSLEDALNKMSQTFGANGYNLRYSLEDHSVGQRGLKNVMIDVLRDGSEITNITFSAGGTRDETLSNQAPIHVSFMARGGQDVNGFVAYGLGNDEFIAKLLQRTQEIDEAQQQSETEQAQPEN